MTPTYDKCGPTNRSEDYRRLLLQSRRHKRTSSCVVWNIILRAKTLRPQTPREAVKPSLLIQENPLILARNDTKNLKLYRDISENCFLSVIKNNQRL